MLERAVRIVRRNNRCSTSHIQRRFSTGYNSAAICDGMDEAGGRLGAAHSRWQGRRCQRLDASLTQ
ncbi:MAG: DNA translocase FtsK [Pseudorhizobium sp.]